MHVNHPIWLRQVSTPGAVVFAIMFTLESLARASLATVIPLQAYALLQDARDVSLLYFGVGTTGLIGSFTIPLLIRRFRRRWVYSMGVAFLILAAALLATGTIAGQAFGMLIRAFGVASTNIALSLYVMDYIRRRDLVRSEPLKLMFGSLAWTAGPALGVYLYRDVGQAAAELLSAASAALLLGYFWVLRLQENPAVAAATRPPPNPIRSIARFLAQPRLRLAWVIPFGRSCWWAMFFVYPPLYMVKTGVGELAGALLVSAGNAMLITTPLVGRAAGRYGMRVLIVGAFITSALFTSMAVLFFEVPWAVAACLLTAAVAAVVLDAVGNIPFLRSVHPYERPQMTTVFRTYIDFSELLPGAVFALLLTFFDMRAVFLASGLLMLTAALIARHLPRRM
jgi:predicted MFS family arabinose efflux permease